MVGIVYFSCLVPKRSDEKSKVEVCLLRSQHKTVRSCSQLKLKYKKAWLRLKKASTGMHRGSRTTVIFESLKHEFEAC